MSFQLNLSHLFHSVTNDANAASDLFHKANSYVQVAEQIGKAWGLTGPQKLEAVKNMLLADLSHVAPDLATAVLNAWPKVASAISVMISIFNAIGWAFVQAAPIIVQAVPEAATAITAVSAAVSAAQAVEKAISPQPQAA